MTVSSSGFLSVAASGNARIDGLLKGTMWAGTISYSDMVSAVNYQANYLSDNNRDRISAQDEGFSRLSTQQLLAMHAALDDTVFNQLPGYVAFSVEALTSLNISYAGAGDSAATIRAANSSDTPTAYTYYPGDSIYSGDVFFGNGYDPSINSLKGPRAGNYAWHTVLHELGHALGLKHGNEAGGPANTALPVNYDTIEYSVMTYRSYVGAAVDGYSYEQYGAPQTYMMLDIAALQYLYGANYSFHATDTIYSWDPINATTFLNGVAAIQPGSNRIFATVWDGGGNDTYDLSNYSTDLNVDLRPGQSSTFDAAQLPDVGGGHHARGNIFNALLYQDNPTSLIENAVGGSGDDLITGNSVSNKLVGNAGQDMLNGKEGADQMIGGSGDDTYVVDNIGDVAVEYQGQGLDTIQTTLASYTLGANVENLAYIGTKNFIGVGNVLANVLVGSGHNDRLDGQAGADTMKAGAGNDTYIIDNVGDVVIELLNGGVDRILSKVSYVLPDHVETLQLATGAKINGTGNSLANSIVGNAGMNVIDGRGGTDTLSGRGGDDIFKFARGEASGDIITDFSGAGIVGGDRLAFQGYGPGATLTHVGTSDIYIIHGGAGFANLSESIQIMGVANLTIGDWSFM